MGSGIAQLAASAALPTVLYEPDGGVLEKAKKTVDSNLRFLVEKGKCFPQHVIRFHRFHRTITSFAPFLRIAKSINAT